MRGILHRLLRSFSAQNPQPVYRSASSDVVDDEEEMEDDEDEEEEEEEDENEDKLDDKE